MNKEQMLQEITTAIRKATKELSVLSEVFPKLPEDVRDRICGVNRVSSKTIDDLIEDESNSTETEK